MREFVGHLLVLGLGTSGEAAAAWALARAATGADVRVTVVDSAPAGERLEAAAARLREQGATVMLGTTTLPQADLVVVSPGIRPQSETMRAARALGVPIISELEMAFRLSQAPWVAITGTNGKTTTTALVTHLLCEAGYAAESAGNIGTPAVEVAAGMGPAGIIVAEVSSFQMMYADTFCPRVGVLLNITPDHLDYHGTMEAYAAEKAKLFLRQGSEDTAVIDVDDAGSAPYAASVAARGVRVWPVSRREQPAGGAYLREEMLVLHEGGTEHPLLRVDQLGIRGDHNVSNALAAAACARAAGADLDAIRRGLRSFAPIEHRLEPAGVVGGVEYFNDSKATNPDAVMKALTAFETRGLVILLGGRNKGIDMRPLAEAVASRARAAVLFGEAATELEQAFAGLDIARVQAGSLADAVRAAGQLAAPGEVVLLSPGCTSFDEFSGYDQRGRRFKELAARAREGEHGHGQGA